MQNATSSSTPRPAATVMLLRERAAGGYDVYLTRRSAKSRFMPDAYVFPGGAVDPADRGQLARERLNGETAIGHEYVAAALRELFEEAGVLLACDAAGSPVGIARPQALAALRAEAARAGTFYDALVRAGLFLDAREVHHYSNWVTPESEPLRFDAHFFVARAPLDQLAEADAFEVHDGRWLRPADALASADSGELAIVFPTRKHLERLAAFDSLEGFFAHARTRTVSPIQPLRHADGSIEMPVERGDW